MRKWSPTIAVILSASIVGCGKNGPSSPAPIITPDPIPAWRLDRSDAVNWIAGHHSPSTWMGGGNWLGLGTELIGDANRGRIVIVKHAPVSFEVLEYDPQWVYHVEDHGIAYDNVAYAGYSWLTKANERAVWMPRRVTPGWTYANDTWRHLYAVGSCEVARVFREPIYSQVFGIETLNAGQLGTLDVLHSAFFHPGNRQGRDTGEHYWYSWDYGWIQWRDATHPMGSFFQKNTGPVPTYETPCVDVQ